MLAVGDLGFTLTTLGPIGLPLAAIIQHILQDLWRDLDINVDLILFLSSFMLPLM
jgi:hypothetical protein